jgi:hypothetical protein
LLPKTVYYDEPYGTIETNIMKTNSGCIPKVFKEENYKRHLKHFTLTETLVNPSMLEDTNENYCLEK